MQNRAGAFDLEEALAEAKYAVFDTVPLIHTTIAKQHMAQVG